MRVFFFTTIILLLASCSSTDRITKEDQGSGAYSTLETGSFSNVGEGVIISIKKVKLSGSKALGAGLGGVLGGLAGSATTDKKYNKEAAAVVGGLLGAIAGSTLEKFTTEDYGYEFLIRTKNGIKAFVEKDHQNLKIGDEVYIIKGSGPVRITRK